MPSVEFPSSTIPWLWRKADIKWHEPENHELKIRTIEKILSLRGGRRPTKQSQPEIASLTPFTRNDKNNKDIKTIVTSFVQYSTGFRQDLDALSKIKGSRYFVLNATQGFGALPIDVKRWKVDFLTTNSYKWLMGGYGGGILYMNKKWVQKFKPSSAGWRSVENPGKMNNRNVDVRPEAARYELGSPCFPVSFAMGAAIEYLSEIGMEKIEKRILEITDFAIQGLEKKGFEVISPRAPRHRSGIVVFKVKEPEKVRRRLLDKKIYTSVRGEGLRIAPHFYNSFEDIEKFLKALA